MTQNNYKQIQINKENDYIFCGYASIFNIIDNQNDVVLPESIKNVENILEKPILWQHDVKKPVGKIVEAYIDDIGLFIYGKINVELIYGKETLNCLKQNTINSLSIGFKLKKSYIENNIRFLQDIKIIEISIVSLPANEMTCIKLINNK